MSKRQNSRKWHQQKRWIFGSLLLFPPLGIPLLWLTHWPRVCKVGGSIFSGILLLSVLTGKASEPTVASVEPPTVEAVEALTKAEPVASTAYENAIVEATAATAELEAAESSEDWARIARQWHRSLSSLGGIPISSDDHSQAQVKIAEYQRNYDYAISQRDAIPLEGSAIAQQQAEEQAIARQQAEEQAIAQQQAAAQEAPAAPPSVAETQGGYVSGTCKDLKASGVGSDFTPGDANYTSARDRDGDGVACES